MGRFFAENIEKHHPYTKLLDFSLVQFLFTHVYFISLLLPFRATFTEPQCKHLNFPSINQNSRRESFDVFMRNQVEAQAFPFFQGKNERVADIVNITFEETINELCDSLVSQLSEASEELLGHFKSGLPKKASSYRKECSDYVDQLVSNDTGVQRKLVEDVKATYCSKMSDMLGPIMKQFMDLTSEKWEKSYREVLNQALEEFHSEEAEIVCQLFEDVRKETLMYHAQVYPFKLEAASQPNVPNDDDKNDVKGNSPGESTSESDYAQESKLPSDGDQQHAETHHPIPSCG
ncbi:hypothetical protein CA3LBN_003276 [Candidozyma haemuli]|uniref:Uncharacterized protein n=1 Tax=Candidozyma haemuli TaxID=45357 RepID=A0ABX8IAR5_9ASCO|nr:hypothetical protein CA3LBN_003276 [[Candida] haemuloni]